MTPYITPEQVDDLLSRPGLYVSLPLVSSEDAAEFFNRMLDELHGDQE